jgi:hypothetical protein
VYEYFVPYYFAPNAVLPWLSNVLLLVLSLSRHSQGEDPDALNNVKIGEFLVEGLLEVPRGNVINVLLLVLSLSRHSGLLDNEDK